MSSKKISLDIGRFIDAIEKSDISIVTIYTQNKNARFVLCKQSSGHLFVIYIPEHCILHIDRSVTKVHKMMEIVQNGSTSEFKSEYVSGIQETAGDVACVNSSGLFRPKNMGTYVVKGFSENASATNMEQLSRLERKLALALKGSERSESLSERSERSEPHREPQHERSEPHREPRSERSERSEPHREPRHKRHEEPSHTVTPTVTPAAAAGAAPAVESSTQITIDPENSSAVTIQMRAPPQLDTTVESLSSKSDKDESALDEESDINEDDEDDEESEGDEDEEDESDCDNESDDESDKDLDYDEDVTSLGNLVLGVDDGTNDDDENFVNEFPDEIEYAESDLGVIYPTLEIREFMVKMGDATLSEYIINACRLVVQGEHTTRDTLLKNILDSIDRITLASKALLSSNQGKEQSARQQIGRYYATEITAKSQLIDIRKSKKKTPRMQKIAEELRDVIETADRQIQENITELNKTRDETYRMLANISIITSFMQEE